VLPAPVLPVATIPASEMLLNYTLYITMELCEGSTLHRWLRTRKQPTEPARVHRMMYQLSKAVCHIHEAGLVHRDLKPANIFFARESDPDGFLLKVGDFGLSAAEPRHNVLPPRRRRMSEYKRSERGPPAGLRCPRPRRRRASSLSAVIDAAVDAVDAVATAVRGSIEAQRTSVANSSSNHSSLTPPASPTTFSALHYSPVGTPAYQAPEIHRGVGYQSAVDIFSLGVIFFELCYPPLFGNTSSARVICLDTLKTKHRLPTQLMTEWPRESALILRMTDPKAKNRPTARELLTECKRWRTEQYQSNLLRQAQQTIAQQEIIIQQLRAENRELRLLLQD